MAKMIDGEANARKAFIEIAQDESEQWHWMMWASNGRPMALSAVSYSRKKDCTAAIKTLINSVPSMKYIVLSHKKEGNGKPLTITETANDT